MRHKRLSYLSIRLTDDEKDLVDEAARAQRLSLSQYVRKRWIAPLRGSRAEADSMDNQK